MSMSAREYVEATKAISPPRLATVEERLALYAVGGPGEMGEVFKLAAVEAGNPFIDPAKIRYRQIVKSGVAVREVERFNSWPESKFATPPAEWGTLVRVAQW